MRVFSTQFLNRVGLLKSYISKQSIVSGGPLTLAIESTTKCNLSCPMCLRATTYFPPVDMELQLFKKIIDEGKNYLEFVDSYGVGEPLLNPELTEMIAYCRNVGIPSGISTNATILSEDMSRKLIEAGLDYIIFAFDGATRETYEKYRRGADFEKVRNNIMTFLRVKRETKSKIFCVLQMVRLKDNQNEIPILIRMWSVDGMDGIRIKKDEAYFQGSAIPGEDGDRSPMSHPCYLLWRGPMYIHQDGTVYPCCYIYPEEAIGNLKKSSLTDIWNSGEMVQLRKAHIRRDLGKYKACQSCPAARPKLSAIIGSFLINTRTVRKVIPFFERMAQVYRISVFETVK